MYTLTWPPVKSMRSICVHLRPKFFPKDSLKSFHKAVSHRRKSYVPFLLPPYPNQTQVITGCAALCWMVTVPQEAIGHAGIAILLSPSSTPGHFCIPFTPAEKQEMEPSSMCSLLMISRSALDISMAGKTQWDISMAFRWKEIRYLYRAAVQSSVQITWKLLRKSRVDTWFYQWGKFQWLQTWKSRDSSQVIFIKGKNIKTICHDWQKLAGLLPLLTELSIRGANIWRNSSDNVQIKVELSL